MSLKRTFSTMRRVLTQLRHDPRTLGLVFFMPSVLIIILYYVFQGSHVLFDHIAPLLLGIIPFTLMFIVSSVAVLRERTSSTLERLLTSPASRLDILFGYASAFALLALVQATVTTFVMLYFLDVSVGGSPLSLIVIATLAGLVGMAFGLLFSAFARNEFQAVQFMPAFVLPQFLTCGLFTPRNTMADVLRYFSDIMPITYVVKALQEVQSATQWTTNLSVDVIVIISFIIVALVLGSLSLRSK